MSLFSLFRRPRGARRPARSQTRLALESLETRQLLSANPLTISGYVYDDANANGLMDSGEGPVAGSTLELHKGAATGPVVATAVSNGSGYYEFSADSTINTAPLTKSVVLAFTGGRTGWSQSVQLPQFDPALGTLTSVVITNTANLNTEAQFENLDEEAATIATTVNGTVTISGAGLNPLAAQASISDSFDAAAFDGSIDSAGDSGHDATQTATGSQAVTLTSAADLARFTGTGSLTLNGRARATSATSGPGNLFALIQTDAGATVQVVYTYVPSNALKPGDYTIVQPSQPAGYLDGAESRAGAVLPGSTSGLSQIPVTLAANSLANNNFAEVRPAAVSGYVYVDANGNGVMDAGEQGLSGVSLQLTGQTDAGAQATLSTQTNAAGAYLFGNLRPGTFTVTELTQVSGYVSNSRTRGNVAALSVGSNNPDVIDGIAVAPGQTSANNNFGKVQVASVSGHVYVDLNKDGVRQASDPPLGGVLITLTGINSQGQSVSLQTTTDASGVYRFDNLRGGSYTITEAQPSDYVDGAATVGNLGGTAGTNQLTLALPAGASGTNYDFGEQIKPGQPQVIPVPPVVTPPVVSKAQLLVTLRRRR